MRTIKILVLIVIAALFNSCDTSLTNVTNSCEEGDFVSPKTNSKILFISRRIENSADWNLFLMNFDGSQQVKITDLTVQCEKVVMSHSAQTILFVHYSEDFFYELYSINIDGTNLTLIDRANRYLGSADWTLDDTKIIYSKNRNESTDDKDLILYDFITKVKVTLTDSGNNYSAKFSPDNRIVYSQDNNMSASIYLMNIDGSNKQLIITDASNPIWSPGGKRIAYISTGDLKSPQIFIACADGSNSRQLTKTYHANWDSGFPTFGNYNPQWSPDGKKIVYQSDVNDGLPEIYIMNSDGSNQVRLTNTDRRNENPVISSDGEHIIFTSNRDSSYNFDIFEMSIDGKNQTSLTKYAGDDSFPVIMTE
jgi:Tol biopolymer transport system component